MARATEEKAISIWESKDFFFELEPLPGAVEAVKQMANLQNTDVFICTSPIKMFKYCPYEKDGQSSDPVLIHHPIMSSETVETTLVKHTKVGYHLL